MPTLNELPILSVPAHLAGNTAAGAGGKFPFLDMAAAISPFAKMNTAANAGSVLGLIWEASNSTFSASSEGVLWSAATRAFGSVAALFTAANTTGGGTATVGGGPAASMMVAAANDGALNDVVALLTSAVARSSGGAVFGANIIARNLPGVSGAKLVGMEIDVAIAAGTTAHASSIGLGINVFNATLALALQIGPGLGGGRFANGIQVSNVLSTGSVLSIGAGDVNPGSLTNSYLTSGNFGLDAHVLQPNHAMRFYAGTLGNYWRQVTESEDLVFRTTGPGALKLASAPAGTATGSEIPTAAWTRALVPASAVVTTSVTTKGYVTWTDQNGATVKLMVAN